MPSRHNLSFDFCFLFILVKALVRLRPFRGKALRLRSLVALISEGVGASVDRVFDEVPFVSNTDEL